MKTLFLSSLALLAIALPGVADEKKAEDHGNTIAISSKNWETEVVHSDKPVLLDFWAPWCGPCMKLGPEVAELSKELTTVKFGKVNLDENEDIARKFDVSVIPYLIVLQHGEKLADTKGFLPPDELKKFVTDALKKAK